MGWVVAELTDGSLVTDELGRVLVFPDTAELDVDTSCVVYTRRRGVSQVSAGMDEHMDQVVGPTIASLEAVNLGNLEAEYRILGAVGSKKENGKIVPVAREETVGEIEAAKKVGEASP